VIGATQFVDKSDRKRRVFKMLVTSREKDQAIMVGDDLSVKVLRRRGKRALVMVSGRRVGAIWDEYESQWLEIEERLTWGMEWCACL